MEYDDELERARERSRRRKAEGKTRSVYKSSGPRNQQWRKDDKKKKRIKIILAEVAVLFVLLAGVGFAYVKSLWGRMADVDWDPNAVVNSNLTVEQQEQMEGYWTIACFGVDSGDMKMSRGSNTDVNILCNINRETGEIKLVSVFRDTYLNINDKNSYNKINAAYAQGGPEQAVKALNKNLDLNIDDFATFNWAAVAQAINLLGGVDIELSANEFSFINAFITETVEETGIYSTHLTHAGLNHLDGVQAVAYGRLRLGDTDFARTERQRIVLAKAFEKAKQANWATLNAIVEVVFPNIATSIQVEELVPLLWDIKDFHFGETAGFPDARGDMDIGNIGDCVVPQTLESNVKALHKFLFGEEDYEVSPMVKEYSRHISEVTGMYNEGKAVGHVPTDGGISAQRYQQLMGKGAASKKPAEKTTEADEDEVSTDENGTDENGTDINGTDENGTDEHGTDENGTDENGTDENGTDVFGTDEGGTDENGTDVYGTDENGTNAEGETYSPQRPGGWRPGSWWDPSMSTDDLIDGPEEESEQYRPTNPTSANTDKPTYETEKEEGPGVGPQAPTGSRPTKPDSDSARPTRPTGSSRPGDSEDSVDEDALNGPGVSGAPSSGGPSPEGPTPGGLSSDDTGGPGAA